ncbi:MAG TPA: DUF6174 domain-containing protein [Gemmatimonadales bacterium]|jgi:hypothetical protein|nr:DUF6174 domain-containing protein [Gemmatimonadales bacterium]
MSSIRLLLVGCLTSAASCQNASGPSLIELQQAQATWASHHLSKYAYRYQTTGFFNALDGQTIRLVVLADTVRTAQFVATNDSVPASPAIFPTIDRLFAVAIAAREDGSLVAAEFDPVFGYPTRLQISGPPDASGAILSSDLELLP